MNEARQITHHHHSARLQSFRNRGASAYMRGYTEGTSGAPARCGTSCNRFQTGCAL